MKPTKFTFQTPLKTSYYGIYNDMLLFHYKYKGQKNTKDNNGKDKTNTKARSRPF
ncbi:hypothetical protein [Helicobacter labetoulli]|uniref:hypothetical protein n=1 Tax=Helicobacter labetoulli TaxID=2315333 RepID=UPI0039EA4A38